MRRYKSDDIFETIRPLYRIPLNDETIIFSHKSFAVIRANHNVQYLLDTCSLPATFSQIIYLFDKRQPCKKEELCSILERLFNSGFITLNGAYHPSALVKTKACSSDSCIVKAPPSSASVHLTDKCNLRCAYCYNEETRKELRQELDVKRWEQLLEDLISSGIKMITATGGEPMIRKDLFPLFQKVRKNGVRTGIISNGSLLSRDNVDLIADSFDAVAISLDSHIESYNDLNRGKGAYSNAMRAISILEENQIPYSINAVLTKHTMPHFIAMRTFFSKYKYLTGGVTPVMYQKSKLNDPLATSYSQIDKHYYKLYNALLHEDSIASLASNVKQGLILLRNGCGTAQSECAIGPDGSLYPCRALYFDEFNAGNVLDRPHPESLPNLNIFQFDA